MKIVALTAVNTNPKYLSCVPFFIDYWLTLKPVDRNVVYVPKILVIANELPKELDEYAQWCELLSISQDISSTFVSQAVRILSPALEDSDYVLTTDVDMLPMSDRVFQKGIDELQNGADFIVCRDVLSNNQYPICYNLASPEVWMRVNGIKSTEDILTRLSRWFAGVAENGSYKGEHGGSGWFADQEQLFELVNQFEKMGGKVVKFVDKQTMHRRLDRLFLPFPLNWILLPIVSTGTYTDYHVHHPVRKHRRFIKAVQKVRDSNSAKRET